MNLLHNIRKIRNDCMHYNTTFKELTSNQLQSYALQMIQSYKTSLSLLSTDSPSNYEEMLNHSFISKEQTFKEFLYRTRNMNKEIQNIDLQINPEIKHLLYTSLYFVAEIDIDTPAFKEITLLDMHRLGLPVIIDLTLPQSEYIRNIKLNAGNLIIATIFSGITTLGQSEEWHLLNLHDVYREIVELNELDSFYAYIQNYDKKK